MGGRAECHHVTARLSPRVSWGLLRDGENGDVRGQTPAGECDNLGGPQSLQASISRSGTTLDVRAGLPQTSTWTAGLSNTLAKLAPSPGTSGSLPLPFPGGVRSEALFSEPIRWPQGGYSSRSDWASTAKEWQSPPEGSGHPTPVQVPEQTSCVTFGKSLTSLSLNLHFQQPYKVTE